MLWGWRKSSHIQEKDENVAFTISILIQFPFKTYLNVSVMWLPISLILGLWAATNLQIIRVIISIIPVYEGVCVFFFLFIALNRWPQLTLKAASRWQEGHVPSTQGRWSYGNRQCKKPLQSFDTVTLLVSARQPNLCLDFGTAKPAGQKKLPLTSGLMKDRQESEWSEANIYQNTTRTALLLHCTCWWQNCDFLILLCVSK